MMEENTIDLQGIWQLARRRQQQLVSLIVATIFFAGIIAFALPKAYESTVILQAKSQKDGMGFSLQASAALALLGGSESTPTKAYIEMMKTRSVLEPVIAVVDMDEEEREELLIKDFVKEYLKISNIKKTDLIELKAIGRSPEEAQFIANAVVESFQKHLTQLNQWESSFMGKFLKNRLELAKTELAEAEQKMLLFRQQEKIYAPTEQASAFLQQMMTYDQQIAQFQVQIENNEARLQAVMEQIGRQNAAIAKYKLADHPTIAAFRSRIVEKQMALFTQEQLYTDKHPSVIRLKQEIDELNGKLQQEVTALIRAGTSTLNPIHSELLADKTKTEVGLYVAQASYDGLKKMQADNEAKIKDLSSKGITYVALERQLRIANEVYSVLVRQYEENRIKEVMESMDVQVVDPADLPKLKSGPKRLLIMAVGGVLGVMFACVYVIMLMLKSRNRNSVELFSNAD